MRRIDLTNRTFGRLTAAWPVGRQGIEICWLCFCVCGKFVVVQGNNLRSGNVLSCGCLQKEVTRRRSIANQYGRKHGHSPRGTSSPEYKTWESMIQRCTNPNAKHYSYYGGRGIQVCERWRDFRNFLADMGKRPSGRNGNRYEYTIDRYPNKNGNYEPGNCRWATWKQQGENKNPRRKRESP